jgi:hypothetical protein
MFETHALNLAISLAVVATLARSPQPLAAGLASYSPGRDANLPMQLLWGDTHLHTTYSPDAFSMGNVALTPQQAYAFARGESVVASNGMTARLNRPLDFLVVSDHAEYLGVLSALEKRDVDAQRFAAARRWMAQLHGDAAERLAVIGEIGLKFSLGVLEEEEGNAVRGLRQTAWERVNAYAEAANQPGVFSAFAGFEWTSMPNGNNLHRVVMFRDDADRLVRVAPFSALESLDPADLWDYLEDYESITGGRAIAIPHNGNASNGLMFTAETFSGEPMDSDHARRRARWEPVVEVTQIKGDGETHPLLSTNDEFADFGTWDYGNLFGTIDKAPEMLRFEYARAALKTGLQLGEGVGVNPFQFGMIGASDAHNGLAAVEEDNFWGKSADHEPAVDRATGRFVNAGPASPKVDRWQQVASGYAGVWATENTRAAIFDAIQRREVYATTGPRIVVRFFAGWDFPENLLAHPDYVQRAYRAGVPMGSELPPRAAEAPEFLLAVQRDPEGANLDRLQIIKGWLDADGRTHERIYNVAWSGNRQPDAAGRLPPVGNTVDLATGEYLNTIGAPYLAVQWRDPHFDPAQLSFYYLRVLEIPTPRWPVYDRVRLNGQIPEEADLVQQERAYSSPIWYAPG